MPATTTAAPSRTRPDQATIRAHRKRINDLVRNDFHFPSPASSTASTAHSCTPYGDQHEQEPGEYSIDPKRVTSWTEYRFASSDASSEDNEDEDNDENILRAAVFQLGQTQQQASTQETEPRRESLGNKIRRKRQSIINHVLPIEGRPSESDPSSPASRNMSHSSLRIGTPQEDTDDGDDEGGKLKRQEEAMLAIKKAERKRRRRRRLEEERRWNQGLDYWARRRNAWCCAKDIPASADKRQNSSHLESPMADPAAGASSDATSSEPTTYNQLSTNATEISTEAALEGLKIDPATPEPTSPVRPDTPSTAPSTAARTSSPTSSRDTTMTSPECSDSHLPRQHAELATITQIPLTMPLLPPDDPSRSQMNNTRAYSAIYSKIIVQGLTPNVPINLQTMTSALVQGWKEDGEWPPKNTEPEPSIRRPRERGSVVGKSVRKGREKLRERKAAKRIA